MPSFFDPAVSGTAAAAFIREGELDGALRRLIPGAYISKRQFSYPSRSELRDLVWNHMDQQHRPFIHRTYGDASRIFISKAAAFSLTRFGRWPTVIPVFDGHHKENGFYQIIVLFGLAVIVNIIECNPDGTQTKMDVQWTIASHRWLRWIHPMLHRRLSRLNDVQNREDDTMRDRRIELRAAGYRFKTDTPDFVSSNVIENNTVFPPVGSPGSIVLSALAERTAVEVPVAGRSFILRRDGNSVEVWPGVCPHEGAGLKVPDLRGNTVKCPWHGLEFGPRRLVEGGAGLTICGAHLMLEADRIVVRSLPTHQ
jgi:hypothetical protein